MEDIYAQVVKAYTPILANAGLIASADGYISIVGSDKPLPFITEGKRWVLPVRERLADPSVLANNHVFHPLSESSLMESESPVLSRLRIAQLARLNFQLCALFGSLVALITSTALHATLVGDQRQLINATPEATEKTMEVVNKLLEVMKGQVRENCFVSIFLKRHAIVRGKTYTRGAIVRWPLYEAIKAAGKKDKIFGVDVKEKDRSTILAVLEYMIPGIGESEQSIYNQGSLHPDAPFLDALLRCVGKIAGCVTTIVSLFGDHVPDHKLFAYSDEWREVMDNPDNYAKLTRIIATPAEDSPARSMSMAAPAPTTQQTAGKKSKTIAELMAEAPPAYVDPRYERRGYAPRQYEDDRYDSRVSALPRARDDRGYDDRRYDPPPPRREEPRDWSGIRRVEPDPYERRGYDDDRRGYRPGLDRL